jgi:hypothetical protein
MVLAIWREGGVGVGSWGVRQCQAQLYRDSRTYSNCRKILRLGWETLNLEVGNMKRQSK